MATQPRRIRAEDLPRIPVTEPGVSGYELVKGELVPVSPGKMPHARAMVVVGSRLESFVREHGGGRVYADVWCVLNVPGDPERVRAPDVAFISEETIEAGGGQAAVSGQIMFRGAPELVVEIHSPANEREAGEFIQKVRDYLDGGVRLLWVIYPYARYATAYRPDGSARLLREGQALEGEDVLPGFRLPLAELFD